MLLLWININRFGFSVSHTALCVCCSSCTFVVGERKFVLFKPKLTVYMNCSLQYKYFDTAWLQVIFQSSSSSLISYLNKLLRKSEWHLACVGFAIFPHVTVQITATQLGAGCISAPSNCGRGNNYSPTDLYIFLLRTGGIQCAPDKRKQQNSVIIKPHSPCYIGRMQRSSCIITHCLPNTWGSKPSYASTLKRSKENYRDDLSTEFYFSILLGSPTT